MRAASRKRDIIVWCDLETLDPGFDAELVRELHQSDAIVLAVGNEGLGRYQEKNELDRIHDAMMVNPRRRLVIACVGGAPRPPALEQFNAFSDRMDTIAVSADDAAEDAVFLACDPDLTPATPDSPEDELALDLMKRFRRQKSLVIVIGPYAFAEGDRDQMTPATAVKRFVDKNRLEGAPPWIDVMGSVAHSMGGAIEERVDKILDALRGDARQDKSGLGVYLRLIAANWQRTPGLGRLFIINTMPDEWIDLALSSRSLPVEHVKLIHNSQREKGRRDQQDSERLQIRHVYVSHGLPAERECQADDPILEACRVMLIKPFGSVADDEAAKRAVLSGEDWRGGVQAMPMPAAATKGITSAVLFVLGAGIFTPNMQMLFNILLPAQLEQKDENPYRYLIHNPKADVDDPLHRMEAFQIRDTSSANNFSRWAWNTYRLETRMLDPLKLLVSVEHFLNRAEP